MFCPLHPNIQSGANNIFDFLNECLRLRNIGLNIFLRPVQKVIIIPGMAHILQPGQKTAIFIGKDSGTDIVLSNQTNSPVVGLGDIPGTNQQCR